LYKKKVPDGQRVAVAIIDLTVPGTCSIDCN